VGELQPDVLLLDLKMPGGSVLDAIPGLRRGHTVPQSSCRICATSRRSRAPFSAQGPADL
jgi:CheY-like chemotaxis protein